MEEFYSVAGGPGADGGFQLQNYALLQSVDADHATQSESHQHPSSRGAAVEGGDFSNHRRLSHLVPHDADLAYLLLQSIGHILREDFEQSLQKLHACYLQARDVLQLPKSVEEAGGEGDDHDYGADHAGGSASKSTQISDEQRLFFYGDLVLGLLDAFQLFGARERYRETNDRALRSCLEAVHALFNFVVTAHQGSNTTTGTATTGTGGGEGAGLAVPTSEVLRAVSFGEIRIASLFRPDELPQILQELQLSIGDAEFVVEPFATSIAEFFLLRLGDRFDELLRIFVFGHARELEKCRRLEREQIFDDAGEAWMVSASINRMAEKKHVARLLWRCFLALVPAGEHVSDSTSNGGPGGGTSKSETSSKEFPSVETFLELCNNDIDLAVKLAVLLLDVEPQIALPLCQLWDGTHAQKAIRETMRQVKEVVTGVISEKSGQDYDAATATVVEEQDASVLDVFEFRKRLAFVFIDNDVLQILLKRCDRLLSGGAGDQGGIQGQVIGQPSSRLAAQQGAAGSDEQDLQQEAGFLQNMDQEGPSRVVRSFVAQQHAAAAQNASSASSSQLEHDYLIQGHPGLELHMKQSVSYTMAPPGARIGAVVEAEYGAADEISSDLHYAAAELQMRRKTTSRATLLLTCLSKCVLEMAAVCFDDKHYAANDVDLLSRKISNVVMRLVRHLALRRQELERLVRKHVLPPRDALEFFLNHPVPDAAGEAALAVGGILYSSRARPLCFEWAAFLSENFCAALTTACLDMLFALKCLSQFSFDESQPWAVPAETGKHGSVAAKVFLLNLPDEPDFDLPVRCQVFEKAAEFYSAHVLAKHVDEAIAAEFAHLDLELDGAAAEQARARAAEVQALVNAGFHGQRFWRAIRSYFVWCDPSSASDPFWTGEGEEGGNGSPHLAQINRNNELFYRDASAEFGRFFPLCDMGKGSSTGGGSGLVLQKQSLLVLKQLYDQDIEDLAVELSGGGSSATRNAVGSGNHAAAGDGGYKSDTPTSQVINNRWNNFDDERSYSGNSGGEPKIDPNKNRRSVDLWGGGAVGSDQVVLANITPTAIPDEYRCAIDGSLMETPVVFTSVTSGNVFRYELKNLQQWSAIQGDVCPITNETFTAESLGVDEALKNEIAEFRARTGCH
eukprot:CAMPEP_0178988774 /NCGR_PEP_ID=MMETSP0795-20121207/3989_1 /TAXON_ID=88552 /ORGANISM="Amoebophrya sp., Strain Ameob2" /LENGTH=1132 /DNA_ID=CAMNT_0020680069 /DNA_START=372 /DNA_END=3773 /DNA_ORIENTATION=-